jgi:hypothetical protein
MSDVTIRDLRHHGGEVVDRAALRRPSQLPVYTANPADFDGIEGVVVVGVERLS